MNYVAKINLSKITKERLYKGKQGDYLNLWIFPKKSEPGTLLIKESTTKKEREEGIDLEILGDMKPYEGKVSEEGNQSNVFDNGPMQSKPVMPKNEHPKQDEDFDPPF